MRPWLISLLGAATLSFRAAGASAQTLRADARDELSTDDEVRYAWLLAELEANGRAERTWWTAWTATYAVLAAGQGAAAAFYPDQGLRADAAVGAVKTALGLAALLVVPREAHGAAARLRQMDARTPEAKRLRRVRAEELLIASANEEEFGRSWVPHVAAAAVNLAGAYVLFREYQRYVPGWASLGTGTLVAELQIVTRPAAAISARNRYAATPLDVRLAVSPAWTGVVLSGCF